ncbi:O-antigen ligase family protein [Crassaminicella thermophila]|nr:O-antigen ligase family protein [Crassaminicella thermophila]
MNLIFDKDKGIELGLILGIFAMPFITFKYISLLMFCTFGCFFLKKLYKKEKICFTPIDGYLLIFLLVLIFSAIFSITKNQSMKELFVYISILLMVFMVTRSFDKKTLNQLLMFFIIAATFVAIYGIYQYLTGAVGGHGWVDVKTNPNLKARAYSTMDNPNILAEYLVIAGSLSVALFLNSKNIYRKVFLFGTTGIILLCLLFTFSRGGWIAFALSMFIILASENKKIIPIAILLGFISLFFLPDVVLDRIKTIGSVKDSSNAYRFLIWAASIKMLKDFWASGVGLGYAAFVKVYPNYTLAGIKAAHAHNSYLQIAIETGILGLLAFLMSVLKAYMIGIFNVYKSKDPFFKRISAASIGAISGLMVHGMVEHILFDYRVIFSFWFAIAIIIASYNNIVFNKNN